MSSFEKIVINKKNVYKCRKCSVQLNSYSATRDHQCVLQNMNTIPNTPNTPLFSPSHMPSPFVQFPTVLEEPGVVAAGPVIPQPRIGQAVAPNQNIHDTPQSRIQETPTNFQQFQQQFPPQNPQWYIQQVIQQERAFREEQYNRQEENHQIQMDILQSRNDKKFEECRGKCE